MDVMGRFVLEILILVSFVISIVIEVMRYRDSNNREDGLEMNEDCILKHELFFAEKRRLAREKQNELPCKVLIGRPLSSLNLTGLLRTGDFLYNYDEIRNTVRSKYEIIVLAHSKKNTEEISRKVSTMCGEDMVYTVREVLKPYLR